MGESKVKLCSNCRNLNENAIRQFTCNVCDDYRSKWESNVEVKVCANCLYIGYNPEGEKYCSNTHDCKDFNKWSPDQLVNEVSKYEQIGTEIGKLVAEKNLAYGDAFGKTGDFMKLLYPNGIKPDQYKDALCLVRIFDKMVRIATDKDAFGESPFRDMCGYSILGIVNSERGKKDV